MGRKQELETKKKKNAEKRGENEKEEKQSQRLNELKRKKSWRGALQKKRKGKWRTSGCVRKPGSAQGRRLQPRIPCGSALGVRLLGNPGKQDGDLREGSPEADVFLPPRRLGRFTPCSSVDTVALRKRASVMLVLISRGAETEG